MKKVFLFIAIIVLGMYCKKSSSNNQLTSISGNWKWIMTYHGGSPSAYPNDPSTPQNTGTQENLILNSDYSWKDIKNGNGYDSGTFTIGQGHYLLKPDGNGYTYNYDSIAFYKNSVKQSWLSYEILSNDTLIFSGFAGIAGGGSIYYVKQ